MTRLLYVHGIDGHGKEADWTDALNRGLAKAGRAAIGLTPIAPDYTAILTADPPSASTPTSPTFVRLDGQVRARLHNEYARRASRVQRLAEQWPCDPGSRWQVPEVVQLAALKVWFDLALVYARDERRRNGVLSLFLDRLGTDTSDLIIVAHSLGSIVALDLLYLLPTRTKVRLLLTAGSPLAIPAISNHLPRFEMGFPFERVETWVNIVEPRDLVTNGRGLSYKYPEVLDLFVSIDGERRHRATGYLKQPVVGEILGDVLYGSKSTGVARQDNALGVPPTKEQLAFLLRLHYAKRLQHAIDDDDRRRRFEAAREMVLDAVEQSLGTGQPQGVPADGSVGPPPILRDLRNDLTDRLRARFIPLEALTLLLLLAMSRPLDPYDIETEDDEKRIAMRNVLDDLELKSDFSDHVLTAIREAADAHGSSTNWLKVAGGTAIAIGAAATVAAPFMIIPFAAAGTAGAAAMTSGLAGIGALVNGGMGAGIVALTSLAAGGSLTAAAGTAVLIASSRTSSDVLQFSASARLISQAPPAEFAATIIQVQALALLRKRLELTDARYAEWFLLANTQAEVAESRNRIELLSDKSSPSVKTWKEKQRTVDRALDWMRDQSLAPPELTADGLSSTPTEPPSIVTRVNERVRKGRRR